MLKIFSDLFSFSHVSLIAGAREASSGTYPMSGAKRVGVLLLDAISLGPAVSGIGLLITIEPDFL